MLSDKKKTFLMGIENLSATGFSKQLRFMASIKIFFFYVFLCEEGSVRKGIFY